MPRRPTREWLRAEDLRRVKRQRDLRVAADAMTLALGGFPEVWAVAVIGSVARPLAWETPPGRPHWIPQLHDCAGLDLAVWMDHVRGLREIARTRAAVVRDLYRDHGISLAHFEVNLLLLEPGTSAWLGALCDYTTCPKGKPACLTPGCGREPLLRQFSDFRLRPEALTDDGMLRLYGRGQGVLRKAAEVRDRPSLEEEDSGMEDAAQGWMPRPSFD